MNMESPAERVRKVESILLERSSKGGSGAESVGAEAANAPHPDDVLARLDAIVQRMPPGEVGDETKFRDAWLKLLTHGDAALRKLLLPARPVAGEFSSREAAALEAIVVVDGSRPSFLLRGGELEPEHPFLGEWKDDMLAFQPALRDLAACVGRIQPLNGGPAKYNGTGTLVDAGKGLVLTNYHVVEHARHVSNVRMEEIGNGHLTVRSPWFIDFLGEVDTTDENLWVVKEVRLPDGVGVSFDGLDAAVLRVEPNDTNATLPDTPTLSGAANYATGASVASLVTIGFPGPPEEKQPPGGEVDWNFVVKTLFNDLFGVKRVAPGMFDKRVGTIEGDRLRHVLSHDATTFGGASGSLVHAWKQESRPAFALHFAGETLVANYAISLHKTKAQLQSIGVPVQ